MYTHGGQRLKQWQLFAQSKEKDRKYRSQLKYTGPYEGTLTPYDALLASGGKVVLFDGQTRSDDRTVEEARWTKAMEGMSKATKLMFVSDCAATLVPPPCPLHSTAGGNALPWAKGVAKLIDLGAVPYPWRAADGTVHVDYKTQLYNSKVATLCASADYGFAKSQQSATAHRARERPGSSRTNQADYMFLRQQRRVEAGIRLLGRPPTSAEYLANPELFEPNLEQPTYADNVRCASCGCNVCLRGGLVLFPHNHDTGILIITLVCRWCDTSGRVLVDRFLFYNVAASDMPLGAECLLRLLRRGDGLGEVSDRANAIVARGEGGLRGRGLAGARRPAAGPEVAAVEPRRAVGRRRAGRRRAAHAFFACVVVALALALAGARLAGVALPRPPRRRPRARGRGQVRRAPSRRDTRARRDDSSVELARRRRGRRAQPRARLERI